MVDRWLLLYGGCCRQVRTLCLVVWSSCGSNCKVVAEGRLVYLYLWKYGRQVVVIVRWLLWAGKF